MCSSGAVCLHVDGWVSQLALLTSNKCAGQLKKPNIIISSQVTCSRHDILVAEIDQLALNRNHSLYGVVLLYIGNRTTPLTNDVHLLDNYTIRTPLWRPIFVFHSCSSYDKHILSMKKVAHLPLHSLTHSLLDGLFIMCFCIAIKKR